MRSVLELWSTMLGGTLSPEWVENLPRGMMSLHLRECNLSGSLPPVLELPKLKFLDISSNELTG